MTVKRVRREGDSVDIEHLSEAAEEYCRHRREENAAGSSSGDVESQGDGEMCFWNKNHMSALEN